MERLEAPWLKALTALPEDPALIPSIPVIAHCVTSIAGNSNIFWSPWAPSTCGETDIYVSKTLIHINN